ncbi:MAG: hypothetical protein IJW50_05295 [Clostridia bacterium]|nr:hypothetical protein [Clostridia bacterium]
MGKIFAEKTPSPYQGMQPSPKRFRDKKRPGSGASTLASYTYLANNGKLDTLTYGNGLQEKYYYDNLDRVSEIWYNTGEGGAMELRYSYTRIHYGK